MHCFLIFVLLKIFYIVCKYLINNKIFSFQYFTFDRFLFKLSKNIFFFQESLIINDLENMCSK